MNTDLATGKETGLQHKPVFHLGMDVEASSPEQVIAAMQKAKPIPIKSNMDGWNPTEPGEVLEGLFRGITTVQMPSMTDPNRMETVECAIFLCASVKDSKQEVTVKAVSNRRAVSYFRNGIIPRKGIDGLEFVETPLNTMYQIIYRGEVKNKTNSFKSKTFDIYRMAFQN